MPTSAMLVIVTIVVLVLAFLNHIYGLKKTGKALKASDHIRHAPVLDSIYDKAENRVFDPYNISLKLVELFSKITFGFDRAVDWVYNTFIVSVTDGASGVIRRLHTGNYKTYIVWSIGVAVAIIIFLIRAIGE